jgi:translation elongation factor EF-Ts
MEPNISKELINELHRLTGAGMMRCKTSLVALVEALKKLPNKTDTGYEIIINFEEYPLR